MICLISALERIEKERYEPLFGSMPAYEITENIINNVKPVIQKIMQSAVGSSKQTHELLDLIGQSDIVKSVLEEKT
jgi:D-arabinose 1-dehydrogenase-like Zn-dependent alcohol dehydrogenase